MLVNNINYLRERYPYIREKLKTIEDKEDKKFTAEETRSGDKTLLYKDDEKEVYFHSKYDPRREAKALIEDYKEVKGQNIIFYGTGLGYHIDLLMTENPDNNYYIFEPIAELLVEFLSERDVTKNQYKNLKVLSLGMENIVKEINTFVELSRKDTIIIELPTHKQVFESEHKAFNEVFLKIIQNKRSGIRTNYSFQNRWTINSMKNFKKVLRTPNIILEKKDKFKGKPVLMVAAGPSLNEDIENIRHIKENGLAYIVSVGSAINTLIHNDIHPDATTSYDPKELNQIVFEKIKEKNITDIPLIFGSSIGYEVIEDYPGEKYHMITSQDQVSNYFLSGTKMKIDSISDAPTIAVITLQLLKHLGFSKIILAGQNLAYVGNSNYSEGVDYDKKLTEEELKNAIKTESVDGNEILTSQSYDSMKHQMEAYIKNMSDVEVINTTKNGVKIKGAEFVELEKLIKDVLKEKIVDENWLEGKENEYDKGNLKHKLELMDKSIEDSRKHIRDYNLTLEKILSLVRGGNFNQVDKMYRILDKSIDALQANIFFTRFIFMMNRTQYGILSNSLKALKLEKNLYKKNIVRIEAYRIFMDGCSQSIMSIMPIYEEMKQDIIEYIND